MTKSLYELKYLKWYDISYNKKKLEKFLLRIKILRFISFLPKYNLELNYLNQIYSEIDKEKIKKLLQNDDNTTRLLIIEKLSRDAATEIIIKGTYSKKTYRKLSNLPLNDFKLSLTRIEELLNMAKNVTNQSNKISEDIPGI